MEKMDRNKFFGTLGKGALVAAVSALMPFKMFSNLPKAYGGKKIKISIHPSAIKRNGKV